MQPAADREGRWRRVQTLQAAAAAADGQRTGGGISLAGAGLQPVHTATQGHRIHANRAMQRAYQAGARLKRRALGLAGSQVAEDGSLLGPASVWDLQQQHAAP